jgi:AbrB family looped-hinge helix DNA binding protein
MASPADARRIVAGPSGVRVVRQADPSREKRSVDRRPPAVDRQRQAEVDRVGRDETALEGLHGRSLRVPVRGSRTGIANGSPGAYHAGTMLSVKISSKHQIAVPSEARAKLGLKAGDRLDVEIEGDVIHLRRHVPAGTRLLGIGAHLYDGTDAAGVFAPCATSGRYATSSAERRSTPTSVLPKLSTRPFRPPQPRDPRAGSLG